MALYTVRDRKAKKGTQPRLVKANSASAALRHVAGTQFDVDVVTSATAAADLLTSGIALEVAGEEVFIPVAITEPVSDIQPEPLDTVA